MIYLNCDYLEGCHPAVLKKLTETNLEQTIGYGEDHYCAKAGEMIKEAFACPESNVHFLVGGTQANTTIIAAALRPYEGVLCADTGHINVHETGAIESSGHKCLALPNVNGIITAEQVRAAVALQGNDEHVVKPGMVYISMSTEVGTVYTLQQLKDLYAACQELGLYLFIDGARLGCALAAPGGDVTAADIAKYSDAFTVGGTKLGALFGEAMVISHPELNRNFRYMIKQRGGMLAKGRLLGLQYIALMEDGLYFELGRKTVQQALRIREALMENGVAMSVDSPTNQQFPILTDEQLAVLSRDFTMSFTEKLADGRNVMRVCTSWATPDAYVDKFITAVKGLN